MRNFNIKKILIPLDFSDTSLLALEHGAYMASLFKADIILLHVVKPNWSVFTTEYPSVPMYTLQEIEESGMKKLGEVAVRIRQEHKIRVETICEIGHVCPVIVSVADEHNVDLIIVGTHGVSGFEERFIGSNAYRVVNQAQHPVITVQTHSKRRGFKDILLPIDNSSYSSQKVNHAVEIAKHYESKIHILGLLNSDDEAERDKLKIKLSGIEEFMHRRGLIRNPRRHIKMGMNYAKLTMAHAEEIGADLIIIMTEWEAVITGLFIGPFARQIVNHSKIPVMSIRPEVAPELIENQKPFWMIEFG